jgi:hypothetical protein
VRVAPGSRSDRIGRTSRWKDELARRTVGGPDALRVQPHKPDPAGEGLGSRSYIGGTCRASRSEQVTAQCGEQGVISKGVAR